MTFKDILVSEAKTAGIAEAEKAIVAAIGVLEKVAARSVVECDDATIKSLAPIFSIVLTALKPELLKLADINHDSKIG